MPRSAHLVGSMAFESGRDAMRSVGLNGDGAITWVPDGETGHRRKWMSQHRSRFDSQDALELRPIDLPVGLSAENRGSQHGAGTLLYARKSRAARASLEFDTFGYAEAALQSYEAFVALQFEGVLDAGMRFQVALPTPAGVLNAFIHPDDRDAFEPVIEQILFDDVAEIARAVPHDQLAFQWDVAHEFGALWATPADEQARLMDVIVRRLVRAGEAIPPTIPLAYHLCYGSAFDVHFAEPDDTQLMADMIRGVLAGIDRTVERLHLPVPIERDDIEYFDPLADLETGSTELYLGLVHHEDGLEGARRRIAAAQRSVPSFGVAAECGTGRTLFDPNALIRLHAAVAQVAAEPPDPTIAPPRRARPRPPADPVAVNDEIRRVAEHVICVVCGAPIGSPCGDDRSARPHMDRYHDAMLSMLASD